MTTTVFERRYFMKKTHQVLVPPEAKPIAWFEQAILAQIPQHGLLDAISLGIWGIAEQSGILAGEWKRHRNFMQDLDVEHVTRSLGALLEAIVQTAHATGISLESVMDLQVKQGHTQPLMRGRQQKASSVRPASAETTTPDNSHAGAAPKPLREVEHPTEVKRQPGRPKKTRLEGEQPKIPQSKGQALSMPPLAARPKRGRPAKQQDKPSVLHPSTARAPQRVRNVSAPLPIQPTLLNEQHTPQRKQPKRKAHADA